ncbi:MAG: Methyltransferase type 11 [Pedosphaera sp.]|nr:Methyltransferase type 11 [Pedosphaera sp.]
MSENAVLDYTEIGASIKASYSIVASKYRRDDEIEITTEHHRRLKGILGSMTSSFGRPISVLDVGCGTGRYFYCLNNVEQLIGIDLCEEMLKIAENPVRQKEVSVKNIELRCENAHLVSFPPQSFDVIYSMGMFGNGCPVTVEICNKFHDWLKPGGKLFFDAVDVATLPTAKRIRRKIRKAIYQFLPQRAKRALDEREGSVPFCDLSKRELERIMRASRFGTASVSSHVCQSPLWQGVHLECAASKG